MRGFFFVDNWFKYDQALRFAVQSVCDHSGSEDRGKWKIPSTVAHAKCNKIPSDFNFEDTFKEGRGIAGGKRLSEIICGQLHKHIMVFEIINQIDS